MTPLQEVIYLYANQRRIPRFEALNGTVLEKARREAERLATHLRELRGEPGRCGRRLWTELETQAAFEKEAAFLAGFSVGLELGGVR